MFSKSDALSIRQGLAEMDFSTPLQQAQLSAFQRYFEFYSFDPYLISGDVFYTAGCDSVAGFDIVSQYFCPASPQGTIVLLHGYLDHVGLYSHAIKFCLQLGFAVVIFDMPGHGLSSGKQASIANFKQYSDSVTFLLGKMETASLIGPWHMIGQSTGAAVMIDCLLKNRFDESLPLNKFIALAPLLRPYAWQTSRYLFALSRPFLSSTKRKFSENSHDTAFLSFLKLKDPLQSQRLQRDWILAMLKYQKDFRKAQINRQSVNIIQGTADTTVDWQYNLEKFREKFPNAAIEEIAGARHHLVNESKPYREQVFASIKQALEA